MPAGRAGHVPDHITHPGMCRGDENGSGTAAAIPGPLLEPCRHLDLDSHLGTGPHLGTGLHLGGRHSTGCGPGKSGSHSG